MEVHRVRVLGVPVDCLNQSRALATVAEALRGGSRCAIFAVNPEKIIQCTQNRQLAEALESAQLLVPDGVGVVLATRLLYSESISRVPGSELMPSLCSYAADKGHSVFLLGGMPSVAERAAASLRQRHPALQVVGTAHGYVDQLQMPEVVELINNLRPDILFVGLGSPRQELWIAEQFPNLNVKVCQAVGGTLDVLAGDVKRAPKIFRSMGFEWFYRLMAQPSRFSRQRALPVFAFRVLGAAMRHYVGYFGMRRAIHTDRQ